MYPADEPRTKFVRGFVVYNETKTLLSFQARDHHHCEHGKIGLATGDDVFDDSSLGIRVTLLDQKTGASSQLDFKHVLGAFSFAKHGNASLVENVDETGLHVLSVQDHTAVTSAGELDQRRIVLAINAWLESEYPLAPKTDTAENLFPEVAEAEAERTKADEFAEFVESNPSAASNDHFLRLKDEFKLTLGEIKDLKIGVDGAPIGEPAEVKNEYGMKTGSYWDGQQKAALAAEVEKQELERFKANFPGATENESFKKLTKDFGFTIDQIIAEQITNGEPNMAVAAVDDGEPSSTWSPEQETALAAEVLRLEAAASGSAGNDDGGADLRGAGDDVSVDAGDGSDSGYDGVGPGFLRRSDAQGPSDPEWDRAGEPEFQKIYKFVAVSEEEGAGRKQMQMRFQQVDEDEGERSFELSVTTPKPESASTGAAAERGGGLGGDRTQIFPHKLIEMTISYIEAGAEPKEHTVLKFKDHEDDTEPQLGIDQLVLERVEPGPNETLEAAMETQMRSAKAKKIESMTNHLKIRSKFRVTEEGERSFSGRVHVVETIRDDGSGELKEHKINDLSQMRHEQIYDLVEDLKAWLSNCHDIFPGPIEHMESNHQAARARLDGKAGLAKAADVAAKPKRTMAKRVHSTGAVSRANIQNAPKIREIYCFQFLRADKSAQAGSAHGYAWGQFEWEVDPHVSGIEHLYFYTQYPTSDMEAQEGYSLHFERNGPNDRGLRVQEFEIYSLDSSGDKVALLTYKEGELVVLPNDQIRRALVRVFKMSRLDGVGHVQLFMEVHYGDSMGIAEKQVFTTEFTMMFNTKKEFVDDDLTGGLREMSMPGFQTFDDVGACAAEVGLFGNWLENSFETLSSKNAIPDKIGDEVCHLVVGDQVIQFEQDTNLDGTGTNMYMYSDKGQYKVAMPRTLSSLIIEMMPH